MNESCHRRGGFFHPFRDLGDREILKVVEDDCLALGIREALDRAGNLKCSFIELGSCARRRIIPRQASKSQR
jgi:hypothetical protein